MEKGTFTDPRDSKVYRTVKIGNQVWMAENLAYAVEGSKYYNNDPANGKKYGRLYDWETAKKACPSGWHLPRDAEWQELVDLAGGKKIAGKKLKAKSGWKSKYLIISGNGTDEFGFATLPGGDGDSFDYFVNVGNHGIWWSATEDNAFHAYFRNMEYDNKYVCRYSNSKSALYSVRCVQD